MSERSTKWQRDNFSNKQILEYLSLLKLEKDTENNEHPAAHPEEYIVGWNEVIDCLEEMFMCLDMDHEEFGAMAYNKESGMFEHIGKEPEEARKDREQFAKDLRERAEKGKDLADAGKDPEIELPPLSAVFEGANAYTLPLAD
tara:strand:- start:761 stop:1189 length:429 start_codon:yes stop_codon:yes gene_type:complete